MPDWIGISLGDVTGIGPEVTLKALAAEPPGEDTRFLVLGDRACLSPLDRELGLEFLPFAGYDAPGRFHWLDPRAEPLPRGLTPGSPLAARAAVDWLREGAQRCLANQLAALVTAPVNKAAIMRAGVTFVGQTEFLSELAGTDRTVMLLLGQDDAGRWLRVALATTHVPLRLVPVALTQERVERALAGAAQACRQLGLPQARIGVCGLNPHAGEGGELGREEIEIIAPAVAAARRAGLDVSDPLAADSLFHDALRGDYDVVVAMYHDQGLPPLKLIAFENGVNWTVGLPFIRTSPDHGTAYGIAGRGRASASSMSAAIRLAKRLATGR